MSVMLVSHCPSIPSLRYDAVPIVAMLNADSVHCPNNSHVEYGGLWASCTDSGHVLCALHRQWSCLVHAQIVVMLSMDCLRY